MAVCGPGPLAAVSPRFGAMRNHRLPRLELELGAIEMYQDDVQLERHPVGDADDLRIGIKIRPSTRRVSPMS
jgi:hypothetical protein